MMQGLPHDRTRFFTWYAAESMDQRPNQRDMALARLRCVGAFPLLLGYFLGWLTGKLIGWDAPTVIATTFNGGMRNISAGAVLAVAYFPAPVAIPVVLGMLFQQSLASLVGYLLNRRYCVKEYEMSN
jgi:predicted Na+-dependent transporter